MSRFYRICCLLLLAFLGGCGGGSTSSSTPTPNLANVSVYETGSPYASVLKGCATATDTAHLCTMATLPLIGQATPDPTVADVMNRVLVSDPWMGARFEQVLQQLPPDILTLLKGVTAIVIDGDVRPSFYSAETAALYIDPANLWLTNAEKATISQAPDYRSDYGAKLQFVNLWRYVKGDNYAYAYYPLDGTETRQLSDIIYPMAHLLYHELAHANDFQPPSLQATLDRQSTPYQAFLDHENDTVAADLYAASPLTSSLWLGLGQVLYFGAQPTSAQLGYSAAQVGDGFGSDVANDPYAYATAREDVAMLFKETMMKYHYDIDRDVAVTDRPSSSSPVCDDYTVEWGERGRIGEPAVKSRAALVASEILPGTDLSSFFAALPAPTPMFLGEGWCANLALGTATTQGVAPAKTLPPGQWRRDLLPPEQ